MDRAIFAIVAVSLYSFELYVSFTKDSTMFAWLFVATLFTTGAFYLFQFGTLNEFSLSAFSANAKFVREKTAEVKNFTAELEQQRKLIDDYKTRIEQAAAEIARIESELTAKAQAANDRANTALAMATGASAL